MNCTGGCRNGMIINDGGDSVECPRCEGSGQGATPPCACAEHRGGASVELYGHRFERASDEVERQGMFLQRWRYVCSCGSRGRWTFQSDSVVYHSWLGHIRRTQAQRYLHETREMYS